MRTPEPASVRSYRPQQVQSYSPSRESRFCHQFSHALVCSDPGSPSIIYRCTIYSMCYIGPSSPDRVTSKNVRSKIVREHAMHIPSYLNLQRLEDTFWQTALETVDTLEIDPACALSLRSWIAIGVQRMDRQRRLASEDVVIAHTNLRKFIELMKKEAVFLGRPDHLDNTTFRAARRRLRRLATLTTFSLWPFWPHNFVATH
jgi:hypothetical protein